MMKELGRKIRGYNIILKLDMAKAYDILEWDFLIAVMNAFGFSKSLCSLISSMLSNCWFSILYNGTPTGYFKSSRGVRQGDPLAPALFIIAEEALSKGITSLFSSGQLQHFHVPRGYKQITHILYADDTLVLLNGSARNIKVLLAFIKEYEASSGQKVNKNKSSFIVSHKALAGVINRIAETTGFLHKSGLQSYLGFPLYDGRKKVSHYKSI